MTATESRPQIRGEELSVPNYESVREVVLNWPPATRAKLMHEMINQMAIGEVHTSSQNSTPNTGYLAQGESASQFSNILDIAGRWNFGYNVDDDEAEMLLAEARLEKYAPELLPEMQKQWEADRLTIERLKAQTALANNEVTTQ